MRRIMQRMITALGMIVALTSMSGCLVSVRFQSFSKQATLPEKLSLADEDSWSDEPVSVVASEVSALESLESISESAEEEKTEQEAESATETASNMQESDEENVETESTETENTEGTTADSFVIPMPPLVQ